jgi:fumarate reductase subunit D
VKALRSTEWLLIGYFSYVALISASRLPALLLLLAMALVAVLVYGESHGNQKFFSIARDWAPLVLTLVLTLVAYREMDWFTPLAWDHHLEFRWIEWDRSLLYGWGFERAVESLGAIVRAIWNSAISWYTPLDLSRLRPSISSTAAIA